MRKFKERLMEMALPAEITAHLRYESLALQNVGQCRPGTGQRR